MADTSQTYKTHRKTVSLFHFVTLPVLLGNILLMAYGVVQAAHSRGLVVPDDLSVVGFDDNPLAKRMRPALTTVRQDVAAKGHAAAAALTAAIARSRKGASTRVRHVLLPTELIVRDSTSRVRGHND